MKKHHEALLIATLAGMVLVGAAGFAVQPASAANTINFNVNGQVIHKSSEGNQSLSITTGPSTVAVTPFVFGTPDIKSYGAMRTLPELIADLAVKLPAAEPITIEECSARMDANQWCNIRADSIRSWVDAFYLSLVPATR